MVLSSSPKKQTIQEIRSTSLGPPIDYSFCHLSSVQELVEHDNWQKTQKTQNETSLLLPAVKGALSNTTDPDSTQPISSTTLTSSKSAPALSTSVSSAVRLSNNNLASIKDLDLAIDGITSDVSKIKWIDLSFNQLTSIEEALLRCPELTSLHLHANCIQKLKDIKVLRHLKRLKSLTLHGNPVEDHKHYRNYVLALVPSLRQIDFSPVTKQDRRNAETWKAVYRQKLSRKKVRGA